jgi:hypothetical protein
LLPFVLLFYKKIKKLKINHSMDTEVVLSLYNHYLLSNICVVEDENLRDEEDLDRT